MQIASSLAAALLLLLNSACALDEQGTEDAVEPGDVGKADSAAPARLLWPGGDVFIVKDFENMDPENLDQWEVLYEVERELRENTPVRLHFLDAGLEVSVDYWLRFRLDGDPWAGGRAPIGIVAGGVADAGRKSVRHEIGHVVGLNHTHTRSDRDDHITFHEQRVEHSESYAFKKRSNFRDIGPYDINSIMHYRSDALSKDHCATLSKGQNDPSKCVRWGWDPEFINTNSEKYTEWNYSVIAALYCDSEYCGDRCAEAERCSTPKVKEHLARLARWNEENPR